MEKKNDDGVYYSIGGFITGVLFFAGIWIYALDSWGLLLGLIFGWIPAIIGGVITGILWPLVWLIILFSYK